MDANTYTVSQLSRMAHVTVRTLHHYDEIGLLVPTERTAAGYRLYTDADLKRLQQILVFRELGFGLDAIAALLEQSPQERRAALLLQRERLKGELQKTERVIRAIESTIATIDGSGTMSANEWFEGMEGFEHADEARERWGDTEAYRESMRRARQYTAADWARIKEEHESITNAFADLMRAGTPATSAEAKDLAERYRRHIEHWFYPCSREFHAQLGEMYVNDARFTETYDRVQPGLAVYVRDAIAANAARGGA